MALTGYVVDASVLIRALAEDPDDEVLRRRLAGAHRLHAPAHLGAEFLNGIRGLTLGGKLTETRAAQAIEDFLDLPITRHTLEPMIPQLWTLRGNFNVHDAAYVALAQALDLVLLTRDRKIADAAPASVQVPVNPVG